MVRSPTDEQWAALAAYRVKKGVAWLHTHAPLGWQWNAFMMTEGGSVCFRAKDNYDNECVLALAFMHKPRFANMFGYVTWGSVVRQMNLDTNFLRTHGFDATRRVPAKILDAAWKEALTTYARPDSIVFRHQTAVDRAFAQLDRRRWWSRLRSLLHLFRSSMQRA